MRTFVGTFICATTFASYAFAAPETTAPLPAYHLRGYYKLLEGGGPTVWRISDNNPWQVVINEPWIEPRLVKWGYVPFTHDSRNYYCQIDQKPLVGSNIARTTFLCGDAAAVFNNYFLR